MRSARAGRLHLARAAPARGAHSAARGCGSGKHCQGSHSAAGSREPRQGVRRGRGLGSPTPFHLLLQGYVLDGRPDSTVWILLSHPVFKARKNFVTPDIHTQGA